LLLVVLVVAVCLTLQIMLVVEVALVDYWQVMRV